MIALRILLVLAAALAAGLAWPGSLTELGFRPDLLLVAAVAGGILGEKETGAWTGILGGLLAAPLTLEPFGFDAAVLGAAGLAAARLGTLVRADRAAAQAVLAGVLSLLVGISRVVRLEATADGTSSLGLLPVVLAGAACTAAAAPAGIFVLDGLGVFRTRRRADPVRTGLV